MNPVKHIMIAIALFSGMTATAYFKDKCTREKNANAIETKALDNQIYSKREVSTDKKSEMTFQNTPEWMLLNSNK